MEQLTVNQLREKHARERKVQAKVVAKKKKELIDDIKFSSGIILGVLSMWLMATILFSL